MGDKLDQPEENWKRYDDSNSKFIYEGSNWGLLKTSEFYNDHVTYLMSDDDYLNNKIKFKFVGTKIRLIMQYHPEYSSDLVITIDGNELTHVDLYAPSGGEPQVLVFEKLNLNLAEHEVIIKSNTRARWQLDAIDVDANGELLSYYQPKNLTALPKDSIITLSWNDVIDADSYTIVRSTTSSAIDTVIATNITEKTYMDNNS